MSVNYTIVFLAILIHSQINVAMQSDPHAQAGEAVKSIIFAEHQLKCGKNSDAKNGDELHSAICKEDLSKAEFLLQNGDKNTVNYQDFYGKTTLMIVAAKSDNKKVNVKMMELLLKHGACVNLVESKNQNALHFAIGRNNLVFTKKLLDAGAHVNAQSKYGTPLHQAASSGNQKIFEELLYRNADINAETKEGYTPLYCALNSRHIRIVKRLLEFNSLRIQETVINIINGKKIFKSTNILRLPIQVIAHLLEDYRITAVELISRYYNQVSQNKLDENKLKCHCYCKLYTLGIIQEKLPKNFYWTCDEEFVDKLDTKYIKLLQSPIEYFEQFPQAVEAYEQDR